GGELRQCQRGSTPRPLRPRGARAAALSRQLRPPVPPRRRGAAGAHAGSGCRRHARLPRGQPRLAGSPAGAVRAHGFSAHTGVARAGAPGAVPAHDRGGDARGILGMSQNINLFNPAFRKKDLVFSFRVLVACLVVTLLTLVAVQAYQRERLRAPPTSL